MTRELGTGYGTLRHLLEREIDEEALDFIQDGDEIYPGIDEHSFKIKFLAGLDTFSDQLNRLDLEHPS